MALLVASCGGGDGSDASIAATGNDPSTPTPTATQQATGEPRVVTEGDTVAVHYRGSLDNGDVFDSSEGRDPLTFVVGSGQVIAGFDRAVDGLAVGDKVTVRMEPAEAYGERRDDLMLEIPVAQAPDGLAPGDRVQLGNGAPAVVLEITDEVIRVDANHELAGQALTFEIELVSIK